MIRRLWFAVVGCSHPDTLRERREYGAVPDVLCWACTSCGHAWPVVSRTAEEHRDVKQAGKPAEANVWRAQMGTVIDIKTGQATVTPIRRRA